MLHLSQYKDNLLQLFRIQIQYGTYLDVIYKGRLYRLHVDDLGIDVKQKRTPRHRELVDEIKAKRCPDCKKLMLNSVCMNSACASNLRHQTEQ